MSDLNLILKNEPVNLEDKINNVVELEALQRQIKEKLEAYKSDLLTYMQAKDILTLKTKTYTVFVTKKILPKVEDFQTLKSSLENENIPVITEETFGEQMKVVFKKLIEEKRVLPGLSKTISEYVSVRLPKKDENA